jgi:hypothetical protein
MSEKLPSVLKENACYLSYYFTAGVSPDVVKERDFEEVNVILKKAPRAIDLLKSDMLESYMKMIIVINKG